MAKKKNESGSWLEALYHLTELIKKEYPDGGKLPPVPEMSRRLNVAENTYCKALRLICQHGLANARQGRGGTQILPESQRTQKIGLIPSGTNPLIPQQPLMHLFNQTPRMQYAIQMIQSAKPENLLDQITILNLCALYVINPEPKFYESLKAIQEKKIPLAIIEFFCYEKIEKAMTYGLPYFHTAPDTVASEACSFAEKNGYKSVMLLDPKRTILTKSFQTVFTRSGRDFTEDHFLPFTRIEKNLLARIKKTKADMIYTKCNPVHAQQICNVVRKLPAQKRPALVFSSEVQYNREFIDCYSSMITGFFDFDNPVYELACTRLVEAIRNGTEVTPEQNRDFRIYSNPNYQT